MLADGRGWPSPRCAPARAAARLCDLYEAVAKDGLRTSGAPERAHETIRLVAKDPDWGLVPYSVKDS